MILPITTLPLASKHRVVQIDFHPTLPYLAAQSHDRSVEVFRIRSEEEVRKKIARRRKRVKEKAQKGKPQADGPEHENDEDCSIEKNFVDYFAPFLVIRASGKVRSFDFGPADTKAKGATSVSLT